MTRFLLCTDLDRTLIPNGAQPESPRARERFSQLVSRPGISLAYVTGRHRAFIEQAIAEYRLPQPNYVIADVGSTLYRADTNDWRRWREWDTRIAQDWRGFMPGELRELLSGCDALRLQEQERQNRHKISYYVSLETDVRNLGSEINARLERAGIEANLIWSIDDAAQCGLLDILPASANKLHAIRFLMQRKGFPRRNTVFAGDSGNDLDVLLSEIPSVVVANADIDVKRQVAHTDSAALYIAKGDYLGMNGNYSAGILEGAAHFWPEIAAWLLERHQSEGG